MQAADRTERFEAPDGRRLAYLDSGGRGPAVLCLAGLTRNHRDFDDLADRLAPRYRVIRLDARGRGLSEHAADPLAEYTAAVETGDALALLGHLGLGRVAVIGTSRGGILGLGMAASRPGLVSGLVLNDLGLTVERAGLERIAGILGHQPSAPDFETAARELMGAHRTHFPHVGLERWLRHAHAVFDDEGNGRPRLSYDPALARAFAKAMEDAPPQISLWPLFDAMEAVPMLVLRGEHSDILTRETVAEMSHRHPGLDAVEIPGRGHAPFLDEPEAVSAIERFLEAHAP